MLCSHIALLGVVSGYTINVVLDLVRRSIERDSGNARCLQYIVPTARRWKCCNFLVEFREQNLVPVLAISRLARISVSWRSNVAIPHVRHWRGQHR